jgi:phosphoenolpyruvate carboxykinase (GTP)
MITAAATGKVGVVRRDPMAMLPFCGYHMADYFQHWLDMGKNLSSPPKIFHVNWFRTDEQGKFLWPGFGENFRVLEWVLGRCEDEAGAVSTPVGYIPRFDDINTDELDVTEEQLKVLLSVESDMWAEEVKGIEEFYKKFGDKLPTELKEELETLKKNINSVK